MHLIRWAAPALLLAGAALAQPSSKNPNLERAQKILEELKYAEAAKSLDAAWNTPGNDHETVLEILKLQAVVAATLGQFDRARQLFRSLLYLAPDYELPEADLGPKVISTFFEAKGRVTADNVLRFEALPTERDEQRVQQIGVSVKADPLKLARSVRFHTRIGVDNWQIKDARLTEGTASLPIEAPSLEWWAELLGEKDRVLALVGSPGKPLLTAKAAPVATSPSLLPPPTPAPEVSLEATAASRPNLKPFAYAAAGAGVVALIAGIGVGAKAASIKGEIDGAMRESDGAISGISRSRAVELNDQMQGKASAANALFVTGAVLVGTGVALYFLSGDVKVAPTPSGVVVGGNLP